MGSRGPWRLAPDADLCFTAIVGHSCCAHRFPNREADEALGASPTDCAGYERYSSLQCLRGVPMKFLIQDFTVAAPPAPLDTMVITEVLLTLFTVAVFLFCWLAFEMRVAASRQTPPPERYRSSRGIRLPGSSRRDA